MLYTNTDYRVVRSHGGLTAGSIFRITGFKIEDELYVCTLWVDEEFRRNVKVDEGKVTKVLLNLVPENTSQLASIQPE